MSITVTGLDELTRKLTKAKSNLPDIVREATIEAMLFVEAEARANLLLKVYGRERKEFARPFSYDLLNAWQHQVEQIGGTVIGNLTNTDPGAIFLEVGTIAHVVSAVNVAVLEFIDEDTGELAHAEHVSVAGVEATHFLSTAVTDNLLTIVGIYDRHLRQLWKRLK